MNRYLFVYGTLRRGGGADIEKLLRGIDYVGEGEVTGRMAMVAEYPGVVADPTGKGVIYGEVYKLDDEGRGLKLLDDYEDCHPDDPLNGIYRRETGNVRMKSGGLLEAWIYIYNHPIEEFKQIESGDFIRFINTTPAGSME